jgi:hypothetical protein
MTLSISPAPGLGVVIRCRRCPHHPADDAPDEWQDTNGDVYFDGEDVAGLRAFLARHGGL